MNLSKGNILLLRAGQAGNINPEKLLRRGNCLESVLRRCALDNFSALREARSIGQQNRRHSKRDETEASPDVL
jgi:hypothetical protein